MLLIMYLIGLPRLGLVETDMLFHDRTAGAMFVDGKGEIESDVKQMEIDKQMESTCNLTVFWRYCSVKSFRIYV